jgi:iron complex outermembrane receptor protein
MSLDKHVRACAAAGTMAASATAPFAVHAQQAAGGDVERVDPVVVTATRVEQRAFDLPVSIDSVGAAEIRQGQLQVNLSESLNRVPGLVVQNRQNYAQDLQVSSRGFGSRATFGVRGIRLYADGIPATMPDGQGQTGNFALSSAQRIEVLRGPFSALYGNASGGVIQVFTEDGPPGFALSGEAAGGSWGTLRYGAKAAGTAGPLNYLVDASHFAIDGYREHSEAERDLLNAKLRFDTAGGGRLTLVANGVDQPAQDPLGLTRAQWEADPRQVDPVALQFDTRKDVGQAQLGAVFDQPIGRDNRLRVTAYGGQRNVTQYLGFSGVGPTSSGGVTDLARDYYGLGVRWTWQGRLAEGPLTVSAGADYDALDERRKGFVNQNGSLGDLRRDEDNTVTSTDGYVQLEWGFATDWSLLLGVRTSRVEFESKDRYVVGANPDDSGSRSFSATNPVGGITWHATDWLNLYANAGRGFETPTFIELAYRPVGTGLNFDLDASVSANYEIGVKARLGRAHRVNAAMFLIDTDDEIVVNAATGGRTTYKNAAGTRRKGLELAWDAVWGGGFASYLAYTWLDATYTDGFTSGTGTPIPAGNRMPGIPEHNLVGELSWTHAASGLRVAVDLKSTGKVYVDDRNSDAADAYTIGNARVVYPWRAGRWTFEAFGRVDNFTDVKYVGSVIVGDTNGRYFESAPERSWYGGISARYLF